RVGKWAVKERVHHAEDRAVGGYSQSQRENHHHKESRVPEQAPRCKAHVRPDRFKRSNDSHVSRYLLGQTSHSPGGTTRVPAASQSVATYRYKTDEPANSSLRGRSRYNLLGGFPYPSVIA